MGRGGIHVKVRVLIGMRLLSQAFDGGLLTPRKYWYLTSV